MSNRILQLTLAITACFATTMCYAANFNNPVEGRLKAVYGDFISVIIPSTTMKSNDSNDMKKGELTMKLSPSTRYENFSQLSDLKSGDLVRVTYEEGLAAKDSSFTATHITKLESATDGTKEVSTTSVTTTTVTTNTVVPDDYRQNNY